MGENLLTDICWIRQHESEVESARFKMVRAIPGIPRENSFREIDKNFFTKVCWVAEHESAVKSARFKMFRPILALSYPN